MTASHCSGPDSRSAPWLLRGGARQRARRRQGVGGVLGLKGGIIDNEEIHDELVHLVVGAGVEARGLEALVQAVGPVEVHARPTWAPTPTPPDSTTRD